VPPDDGRRPGNSVEREVFAQHRRLDALFEEVLDSLRGEHPAEVVDSGLQELREVLETHFDQEDKLYYPTIWALRPELKPQLVRLTDSHGAMLADLDRVRALLDRGEPGEALQGFERLSAVFQKHEEAEEAILSTLDREIDATR